MKTWEYHTRLINISKENFNEVTYLKSMGLSGWELVSVMGYSYLIRYYFKKEIIK